MRFGFLVMLAACGGVDPSTEALVGTWTNDDDGVARELRFADGATYAIRVEDAEVQTGTYVVADDTLVTIDGVEQESDDVLVWTVATDASGSVTPGTSFGDPIYRFTNDEMDLRSASAASGRRTWARAE